MSIENKTLKFEPDLVPLVLSEKKDSTWRLWDDKDLQNGDRVTFIRKPEFMPFAVAEIISCVEKPLGTLTEEDKKGHEPFKTDKEMYETYTTYYKREVGPETPVKILRFKIIQEI